MILRNLFEARAQSVGIIFGRFNPPHKGHRKAWEMASENDAWYVGTNQSTQGPKDPLPYNVKIEAMKMIYPEIEGHIMPEQSWLTMASRIYEKYGDIVLRIYTDEEWVVKTIVQYNGREGPHGLYNFKNIDPVGTPRLSSATELRNAVAADDREAFSRAAGIDADTPLGNDSFFDVVKHYLTQQTTKPAKKEKAMKVKEYKGATDQERIDAFKKQAKDMRDKGFVRAADETEKVAKTIYKPKEKVKAKADEGRFGRHRDDQFSFGGRMPRTDRIDRDSSSGQDAQQRMERKMKQQTIDRLLDRHPDWERSDLELASLPELIQMLREAVKKPNATTRHLRDYPVSDKDVAKPVKKPEKKKPEQGVAEGSDKNVIKSVKVGNFRHDLVDTGMGWQVRIYNGDELYDTGMSKNSEQKGLAALENAVAYTEKQTRTKRQGVAEGHADQQRKIFKKNGKPVGEVGIDRESSPGVGQWYMKCYVYDIDNSGYDSYEEAVAELKHCLKQGVAEATGDKKFDAMMGNITKSAPVPGDNKFDTMMGNITKSTPVTVTGSVAVEYASESPSDRIKGVTLKGRPMPNSIDPDDLDGEIEFGPDEIQQQLFKIGRDNGWSLIDTGQGRGYSEMFFDTNASYSINTQSILARNIINTVTEINKFFNSLNRSLQTTGVPGYRVTVWQEMSSPNGEKIRELDQIKQIARTKVVYDDPGEIIGKAILQELIEMAKDMEDAGEDFGYSPEDFAYARKIAKIYITKGERAGLKAQVSDRTMDHVSNLIDELLDIAGVQKYRTLRMDDLDDLDEQAVAETTGDNKFDKMMRGITSKRAVKQQKKDDTKQQARDAFGSMFGGGNPADKLGIGKKGVAEDSDYMTDNMVSHITQIITHLDQEGGGSGDRNTFMKLVAREMRGIVKDNPKLFRRAFNIAYDRVFHIDQDDDDFDYTDYSMRQGERGIAESKEQKVPQKPRQGPLRPQTGAGRHQDKKKAQKQGKEKHKKPLAEAIVDSMLSELDKPSGKLYIVIKGDPTGAVRMFGAFANSPEEVEFIAQRRGTKDKSGAKMKGLKVDLMFLDAADAMMDLKRIFRDIDFVGAEAAEFVFKNSAMNNDEVDPRVQEELKDFMEYVESGDDPRMTMYQEKEVGNEPDRVAKGVDHFVVGPDGKRRRMPIPGKPNSQMGGHATLQPDTYKYVLKQPNLANALRSMGFNFDGNKIIIPQDKRKMLQAKFADKNIPWDSVFGPKEVFKESK